ncbi:MAG: SprT-like domain-containing protein [Deltaproteobacteria bacterium]|nr:SprT-like domain-containing protein [Deltaproteobacteria bacterium]
MKRKITKKINAAIVESRSDAFDWPLCSLSSELYWWTAFFNTAFFKTQPVPMPILSFQKKSVKNLGHYQKERNGFGLKENININQCHLHRPLWEILVILIHEMCHSWQDLYGKASGSWFHNKEFRNKMAEIGIVMDTRGRHLKVGDPFVFFLEKHGIKFGCPKDSEGSIKVVQEHEPKGRSKLKKWECLCGQSARVGKKEFYAVCTLCEGKFTLVE